MRDDELMGDGDEMERAGQFFFFKFNRVRTPPFVVFDFGGWE